METSSLSLSLSLSLLSYSSIEILRYALCFSDRSSYSFFIHRVDRWIFSPPPSIRHELDNSIFTSIFSFASIEKRSFFAREEKKIASNVVYSHEVTENSIFFPLLRSDTTLVSSFRGFNQCTFQKIHGLRNFRGLSAERQTAESENSLSLSGTGREGAGTVKSERAALLKREEGRLDTKPP